MVNQHGRPPAPIDAGELEATLGPFALSRMLPRAAYVDGAVFAWEQRNFFAGGWMCVGRSEDLAAPGDQRAESVGHAGVLLTRDTAGDVHGFANVCRHRGHELLPCGESANRRLVVCPYHAWSYRLDGTLHRSRAFEELDSFDPSKFGLVELPTEEWHGLVFVDSSGTAGPLAVHLEGLEPLVAPYGLERLRVAGRHDYEVAANWKILTENYQECYHCPVIHPELCAVSPPESGGNYIDASAGAWVGGWMDLREGADTMSLTGRTPLAPLPGLDEKGTRTVLYLAVFPNLLLSLHPEYVMAHLLTPLAADRTRIRCTWAFSPEAMAEPDFDPSFAVDFWDVTNRQDWGACESVQRGMASEHARPGPIAPEEDGVYQFDSMVARGYTGRSIRVQPVPIG